MDESKSALLFVGAASRKSGGSSKSSKNAAKDGDHQAGTSSSSKNNQNASETTFNVNIKIGSGPKASDSSNGGPSSSKSSGKHRLDSSSGGNPPKRQKTNGPGPSEPVDGISEDAVRRYLMRKPMTAKDLLQKFKKSKGHEGDNRVAIIAEILKKLNPVRQTINEKLYFSLKST